MLQGRRVLLCVTGGVAAYKSAYLARRLVEAGATVRVEMTSPHSSSSAHRHSPPSPESTLSRRCSPQIWCRPTPSWPVGPSS